jgi:hypothetical protein
MEIRNEFTSHKEEHEPIIEDQNHCCLCGTALKFQHQVDYLNLTVKEDGHCPSCQVRLKSRDHRLQ